MTRLRRDDDPRHIVKIFLRGGRIRFRRCMARIRFHFVERLTSAADLKFLLRGRWFDLGTSRLGNFKSISGTGYYLSNAPWFCEVRVSDRRGISRTSEMGHWDPY
jgi:hypothetical protein